MHHTPIPTLASAPISHRDGGRSRSRPTPTDQGISIPRQSSRCYEAHLRESKPLSPALLELSDEQDHD